MQKILVLIIAALLGLIAFMFATSRPAEAPAQVPLAATDSDLQQEEGDGHSHTDETDHSHDVDEANAAKEMPANKPHDGSAAATQDSEETALPSDQSSYTGEYTLIDPDFGTAVVVSLTDTLRVMESNSIANHEVGDFPRSGNPNTISEQDNSYTFPLNPTYVGTPEFAREPGIAVNGVKFEPQTAERVTCESGEQYSIEAVQDMFNLGLDFNNAHVQPTGAYHYHAVADNLVEAFDEGGDLVHVGFAKDGYLMYYSKSGAYDSGYALAGGYRSGEGCVYTSPNNQDLGDLDGTKPDGTYVSDWLYTAGSGDLDECNGTTIDGEYVYLLTDEYPYIPRCLMGEFVETAPGGTSPGGGPAGGGPTGQGGERPNGPPPR